MEFEVAPIGTRDAIARYLSEQDFAQSILLTATNEEVHEAYRKVIRSRDDLDRLLARWDGAVNRQHTDNQQETKMNINDLTIGQARELAGLLGGNAQPEHRFKVGTAYLVLTVTKYFTGVLTWVGPHEIALSDCAWVADTGRFADALKKASFNEVEPFPPGEVIIGRGAIIAASELTGPAPTVQK